MKQLYISDLDGTLLNRDKEVSEYTRETLNALIEKGVNFSVATARTTASAAKILSELNINVPAVLMNGVVIYDLQKGEYIKTEVIPPDTVNAVISIFQDHDISGFMYGLLGNELTTYYESLNTPALQDFRDERVKKYYKTFEQTDSFLHTAMNTKIIYFCLVDMKERLFKVSEALKEFTGIDMVLYKDIYDEKLWYLEIFSKNASKRNAVNFLRDYCGFDTIIGFGDNYNDIPLFEACDEGYAVENAVEELKKNATGIVSTNISDGVARFIAEREGL